ncbi:Mss4p nuclear export [Xylographa bjoerkii]|nr:Mss4p nuclear export [Xylographa bjoerkii]
MQLTQLMLSSAVTFSMVAAINGPVINPHVALKWAPQEGYHPNPHSMKDSLRLRLNPHVYTGIKKEHLNFHAPIIVTRGNEAAGEPKPGQLGYGDPTWVSYYGHQATEPVPKWAEKEMEFPHHVREPKVKKIQARGCLYNRHLEAEEHRQHEEEERMRHYHGGHHREESHEMQHHSAREAEADPYSDPESFADANRPCGMPRDLMVDRSCPSCYAALMPKPGPREGEAYAPRQRIRITPMAKRKVPSPAEAYAEEDTSSDSDTDMLDVDFEWFDPQPEVDFHGLKTLLRQLLDVDSQLVDISALADLILAQPLLGSTVKVDGNETDPYAFLSVINLREHKEKPVVKSLIDYIVRQTSTNSALSPVADLLQTSETTTVGLILTERLINIPSEVVPPMYRMLLEEITWAIEEKEPYSFSHYLIISKTYKEVSSKLDTGDDRPQKKKKKEDSKQVFYFHPEDEVLQRHAIAYGDYTYVKEEADGQADAKRAFQDLGVKPQGHMILLEASQGEDTVKALEDFLRPA